jgi:hypothetical protein
MTNLQELYVREPQDLYNSVMEFNEKPEFWKAATGNAPKYFLHIEENGNHYFGLSKFCVLKNISVEVYISTYRYQTDGNNARLIIQNRFKKDWIPRSRINRNIKIAFDEWISDFFPNYNLDNANFISVDFKFSKTKKPKKITPEKLREILDLQIQIGEIGGEIAYEFEFNRLKNNGVRNPTKYIKHVSKENAALGFDISSILSLDETRFIEVKSSVSKENRFYLSENEVITLELLADTAFLYFVRITDLTNKIGFVERVIQNPISKFRKENRLEAVAYRVKI